MLGSCFRTVNASIHLCFNNFVAWSTGHSGCIVVDSLYPEKGHNLFSSQLFSAHDANSHRRCSMYTGSQPKWGCVWLWWLWLCFDFGLTNNDCLLLSVYLRMASVKTTMFELLSELKRFAWRHAIATASKPELTPDKPWNTEEEELRQSDCTWERPSS